MTGRIDDREIVFRRTELIQRNVDGHTPFPLGLQAIEYPRELGRWGMTELARLALVLVDGLRVDAAAFVYQVSGRGGFARVDVADDD